ncbi:hypothetical protein H0E87_031104 [Populus deltoides]|uniref:SWIM-type domain-containing protein n=1 Tax=Populus deltoides TaxID=3696 RepID=A0A8T2WJL1_POPDE|nr:hypothetical protein H0E87_031104 [Populus deltoides]
MANHDLILGQSHNLGLRQNQQLVLGHDHSLGLGQNHDLELGQAHEHHLGLGHEHELDLGHPHDDEMGLGQSQNDEGEAVHNYGHGNDLVIDRKPEQGDHELALTVQNHELALSESNELVVSENQELDDNLQLTVDEDQEMGLEHAQGLTIEESQLIVHSPVIQARTLSIAPNYEMAVGQEFPDVFSCRRALRDTAIALHFEMQTIKSDKTRFTAKCASDGCPWRIHAAKLPGVPTFTIRTIHESHTCGGISHLGHQQASVQWVANSRRVAEALERARTYQVLRANEAEFEVISHEGTNIVDIRNRCCLCRGWQLYGLPCAHAVAALLSCRQNVHRFTESCFTVATYRKTYSQTIHPIPDKSLWTELSDGDPNSNKAIEVVINPPKSLRPPGRPRKKRVRAEDRGRVKRVVHCSRCNQTGHFRTTCAAPI